MLGCHTAFVTAANARRAPSAMSRAYRRPSSAASVERAEGAERAAGVAGSAAPRSTAYSFSPPPSGQNPYSISTTGPHPSFSPALSSGSSALRASVVRFSARRRDASSASHSRTSVPASASELFCVHLGWCGSPVRKLTSMMGIPVRVLNAGASFSARSSALASRSPSFVSPPSSCAAHKPPRMRIVLSNTFAFLSAEKTRPRFSPPSPATPFAPRPAIQSLASSASSSRPMTSSVSSASTMVSPTSSHSMPRIDAGASSSFAQACSR